MIPLDRSVSPSPPSYAKSIVETIGNTPMVELSRIADHYHLKGKLLAKIESFNPGFSKKDRIAREMILEARKSGQLANRQTVVELTSGNTGTGLAIVCQSLGHPFVAVMSKGNTIERARMMQALGAEVILVDQAPNATSNQVSGDDLARVEEVAQSIVKKRNAFRADQFTLQSNILAHERYTGPEIWKQAGGKIDAFVDFAGTGGTFTGVSKFLKSKNQQIQCYLIEPASAAILSGSEPKNKSHKIQGGGYSLPNLPLLDRTLVTQYLKVSDKNATEATRLLAAKEGIFAGFSSGANLAAAIGLLQKSLQGKTIAFLICDSGLKYLSTDLFPWNDEQ